MPAFSHSFLKRRMALSIDSFSRTLTPVIDSHHPQSSEVRFAIFNFSLFKPQVKYFTVKMRSWKASNANMDAVKSTDTTDLDDLIDVGKKLWVETEPAAAFTFAANGSKKTARSVEEESNEQPVRKLQSGSPTFEIGDRRSGDKSSLQPF
jgi:hypothetical protein